MIKKTYFASKGEGKTENIIRESSLIICEANLSFSIEISMDILNICG